MSVRVAINGFGRIGRQSLKAIIERHPELDVVAVNDLADTELNALLFAYDSTYGRYPGSVDHTEDSLIVDGRQIKVLKEKDPAALPWRDLALDVVIESTGIFTTGEKARAHLDAGIVEALERAEAFREACNASLAADLLDLDSFAHAGSVSRLRMPRRPPRAPRSSRARG